MLDIGSPLDSISDLVFLNREAPGEKTHTPNYLTMIDHPQNMLYLSFRSALLKGVYLQTLDTLFESQPGLKPICQDMEDHLIRANHTNNTHLSTVFLRPPLPSPFSISVFINALLIRPSAVSLLRHGVSDRPHRGYETVLLLLARTVPRGSLNWTVLERACSDVICEGSEVKEEVCAKDWEKDHARGTWSSQHRGCQMPWRRCKGEWRRWRHSWGCPSLRIVREWGVGLGVASATHAGYKWSRLCFCGWSCSMPLIQYSQVDSAFAVIARLNNGKVSYASRIASLRPWLTPDKPRLIGMYPEPLAEKCFIA